MVRIHGISGKKSDFVKSQMGKRWGVFFSLFLVCCQCLRPRDGEAFAHFNLSLSDVNLEKWI